MANDKPYIVPSGWRLLLHDAGIDSANVLRRASLPEDLLSRDRACLSRDEYYRLWQGIEDEGSDPALPLRIAAGMSVEAFDPPVFAAFCSPNLNIALARLAKYKRLTCGKVLTVEVTDNATTIVDERLDKSAQPPATLVLTELVFVVQLGRIATRERICPLEVRSPILPGKANDFTEFFGVSVRRGDVPQVRFSSTDASRPFLTASESMWTFFEKELNKRLADLTESATMRDKVHAVLLELLPAGGALHGCGGKKIGCQLANSAPAPKRRTPHLSEGARRHPRGSGHCTTSSPRPCPAPKFPSYSATRTPIRSSAPSADGPAPRPRVPDAKWPWSTRAMAGCLWPL